MFITVTGVNHYLGIEEFKISQKLYLEKEEDNRYDDESIAVKTENNTKCGYVANSVYSVARGTHSAGYVYRLVEQDTMVKIRFILDDKIIAEIIDTEIDN